MSKQDIKVNISGTAFLVNHSRALRQDVSLDRFAGKWVPEELVPDVKKLWADYAASVYTQDDIVCALRNRIFLDTLKTALAEDSSSPCHFVSFGAGFSSYPWLIDDGQTQCATYTEIDMPSMVAAKKQRIVELGDQLPTRPVEFLEGDFLSAADRERVGAELRKRLGEAPVRTVVFMEGLTYYLNNEAIEWLYDLARQVSAPGSMLVISYWNRGVLQNSTFRKQIRSFEDEYNFEESAYAFIEHDQLENLKGYTPIELTSCGKLENRYMSKPELKPEDEVLPEYVAVLKRT